MLGKRISLLVFVATLGMQVEAHGHCGKARCWTVGKRVKYTPYRRHYNYHRRYGGVHGAIDVVGSIFSVPFYSTNFLHRQQKDHLARRGGNISNTRYVLEELENGNGLELTMEVPGFSAENLTVEVQEGKILRVAGNRNLRERVSIVNSEFEHMFQLGEESDVGNISVRLYSGILTITVPRKGILPSKIVKLKINEENVEASVETNKSMSDMNKGNAGN